MGEGQDQRKTKSHFRVCIWGSWTLMTCMIHHWPVSLVMWDKPGAPGPAMLFSSSPAPLSVAMCNLSTFRVHLTFLLTSHRVKDRFVCAGHLLFSCWHTQCNHRTSAEIPAPLLQSLICRQHYIIIWKHQAQDRKGTRIESADWTALFMCKEAKIMKYVQNWKKRHDQFDKHDWVEKWVLPCFNCTYWSFSASVSWVSYYFMSSLTLYNLHRH